jgi:primosomal protein N' (replication factor Y)
VADTVAAAPGIVVATPGAEPVAAGGYACVVLLDTWLMLARPDLRSGEESLRRWLNAAALARPRDQGGRVVAVGSSRDPALQAVLRWDPGGFAERELAERRAARLPPACRLATISGSEEAVAASLAHLQLPAGTEVLGPVAVGDPPGPSGPPSTPAAGEVRAVLRVPRAAGARLDEALAAMQRVRSARKLPAVRVQVDPIRLG